MSRDSNNTPFKATLTLPQIIALYTGAVLGSGTLIIPGIAAEMAGPASLVAWGLMSILGLPMALTIVLAVLMVAAMVVPGRLWSTLIMIALVARYVVIYLL